MEIVRLNGLDDADGWRQAARRLVSAGVPPEAVVWSHEQDALDFGQASAPASEPGKAAFSVPRAFADLAATVLQHRDPRKYTLLYRLLWRVRQERHLIEIVTDPDVAIARAMEKAIRRDKHKMKAFVRFRDIGEAEGERFVAWFEPDHFIVRSTAPFFQRRFTGMHWSILTPDLCAHWDRQSLTFSAGASKADAPAEDASEEDWKTYYSSIFNPARLKVKAMTAEMPRKYWRNLPEASLIDELIARADAATSAMVEAAPGEARRKLHSLRVDEMAKGQGIGDLTLFDDPTPDLATLRAEAAACRNCPLWAPATQTVFGEGPAQADMMFVGEQPGDKEDIAGRPFVGPAGQMFDKALAEIGIDRSRVYVTNAVKHFKFAPRGKFRLHQKPATPEIKACRPWLERELAAVQPRLIVALGATAAQSLFGRTMAIGSNRGRFMESPAGQTLITVHPSYLLRLPDENAKAIEYGRFLEDLALVRDRLAAA